MNDTTLLKMNILGGMNELVKKMNDEEAYYNYWIDLVPDEATEEDLQDIAECEELFRAVCERFAMLVRMFGDDLVD